MEHLFDDNHKGKPKYSERNLSQCHFVHHTPQMDWHRIEKGLRVERLATNQTPGI